jgi:uncharacterized protein
VLTQDRPEIERDYDAMLPAIADAFAPYYSAMVDGIATIYAGNFTVDELRAIEAFYRNRSGRSCWTSGPPSPSRPPRSARISAGGLPRICAPA